MKVNRREMLQWMGGACSALALSKFERSQQAAQSGLFLPTRESLASLQDSGLVSRCQVRHLGALGTAIGD